MFEFSRFVLISGWLSQLLYMSFHIANSNCLTQGPGPSPVARTCTCSCTLTYSYTYS